MARLVDVIEAMIKQMIEENNGSATISRSVLAERANCVPSQVTYVLSTRFSTGSGYIVESRRGGGGYIRITRVTADRRVAIMHIVNSIGNRISSASAETILSNMSGSNMISEYERLLISSALSDKAYSSIPQENRDILRAAIMKNMLITLVLINN